ncbi:28869_t:CDS:2, partial [Racocetra persica]
LVSRPEEVTLKGHSYTSSSDRNDTALLDTYRPEKIYSQYIIRMAGKGYTPLRLIIDIDARQKPDPTNPKVPSLDDKKIIQEDLLSRILVACADALSLISVYYRELKGFTEKVIELVGEPYSKFIDY